MYILKYEDAERTKDDPELQKLHKELIHLGLVHFNSGYANVMVGLQWAKEHPEQDSGRDCTISKV